MINLIVADDHVVMRTALCELLTSKGKYCVVGQAGNGKELLELLKGAPPDVVILDLDMPQVGGVEALQQMNPSVPVPPVLILSSDEGERNIRAALKAGAKGYLPKHAAVEELEFALEALSSGKTYLSPSVTSTLMSQGQVENALDNPTLVLTKREVEILKHLADGKKNRDIGKLLHISTRTVDTHRSNILKKLNLKTNAELVKFALTNNLISL
jgi:DNA-binding NarL/FixJ family response regulator